MTPPSYDPAGGARLAWGPAGAVALAGGPAPVAAVVVDVLSFTTTVGVAADRGVAVLPWRWRDPAGAASYADEHAAHLAVGRSESRRDGGPSLSPVSVRDAPVDLRRLVLPSPNGATVALALAEAGATVVAGSLRNATAVADHVADLVAEGGHDLLLVAAGERWAADDSLRPAVEDLWGAGAVLEAVLRVLPDLPCSPGARAAAAAWRDVRPRSGADLAGALLATDSGRELAGAGWTDDVRLAAEHDSSTSVPVLQGTSFVPATGMRAL
ncbi:hypothetical protein GCM10009737_28600 [Nocardioides lentus]|uniref:Probable 2-phosphosulfolactate phosphatase n=1 Tax=Nocardioides lentus TaxID=338077 RepID=A0ABN2PNE8_9ACTN